MALLILLAAIIAFLALGGMFLIYSQEKPPQDEKILETNFKIHQQGDEIIMEPLLCPSFKLVLIDGDGKEPNTITKCAVYKHVVDIDEKEKVVTFVTVLKCGRNTYGLSEVDFQKENPN